MIFGFSVETVLFIRMERGDQIPQYGIFQSSIFSQYGVQFFEDKKVILYEGVDQFNFFIFRFDDI